MPYPTATAVEIDRKLREDFRKRLKEYGVNAETTDPILAVLFRTFAQQLEVLYSDTERIRLALLDELISSLGIEKRMARPAQTVVRFSGASGVRVIEAGTAMTGETSIGGKMTFASDATIHVSDARLCCALAYEEGAVRLLSGIEMPEKFQAARPSLDAVKTNLGPNPALYLAIDPPARGHIGGHSFFFDLSPDARDIQNALTRETWCFCNEQGYFAGLGILRPLLSNAGVRHLEWLIAPGVSEIPSDSTEELPPLPPGFYGGKIYVLPVMPRDRNLLTRVPKGLETELARVFGREAQNLFNVPRAWIKITFPKGLPSLHTGISGISMHAITASNVECLNQTVYFERHGNSIPISKDGGTNWHLVAPLSVISENDTPYLPETEPTTDPKVGRFAIRNGRIELTPARWPNNKPHTYANIRVWISGGAAGNQVGPGKVSTIQLKDYAGQLRVGNPTAAAGGTNGEDSVEAQDRFAAALLSRDRVVTRGDLYAIVKSFDRRIREARIKSGVSRADGALRRVEQVTLTLRKDDFNEPELESRYLTQDIHGVLQKRFLHDIDLSVDMEWEA